MKARTVAGRGKKSLLYDPGSELRVGRRERRRCAKIMNGMRKKIKNKNLRLFFLKEQTQYWYIPAGHVSELRYVRPLLKAERHEMACFKSKRIDRATGLVLASRIDRSAFFECTCIRTETAAMRITQQYARRFKNTAQHS